MRKLTFTNSRGSTISLGNMGPYLMTNIEGIGAIEADIQMQKAPFQDGTTYTDSSLSYREIVVEGAITERDRQQVMNQRQLLHQAFNTKLGKGVLLYEQDGIVREIDAVVDGGVVLPDKKQEAFQRFMVSFTCPDPYWRDINPTNIKLEDFVSSFRFPFSFPVRFATRGDSRVLINEGHVPTPVKITFRGEAINPKITNQTTGEFIQINRSIPKDYSLVINTEFGNKTIEIIAPDGIVTSAAGYMDLGSELFDLEVGENKINFITEGGKPEVYIEYKNRYLGV
ncbi:phage tail family protein [Cytobacillus sp. Hm23]